MIYLVIFMAIFICFLLGFIVIQKRDLKKLGETLAELEVVLSTMDRAKEFEKNRGS